MFWLREVLCQPQSRSLSAGRVLQGRGRRKRPRLLAGPSTPPTRTPPPPTHPPTTHPQNQCTFQRAQLPTGDVVRGREEINRLERAHTCMCACADTRSHTERYTQTLTHAHTRLQTVRHTHARTHARTHAHTHSDANTHTLTDGQTHTQSLKDTHTHTHT